MEKQSLWGRFTKRYIGDKAFYLALITLVIPIVVQQGITTLVSLLDNIMVGALCTESISGVAIVNQLLFVFQLTIFGALSGASIYGAQYFGNNDMDGVRHAFRFKLIIGLAVTAVALAVFYSMGDKLVLLYIHSEASEGASAELTLSEAQKYMGIALLGLFPFMLSQSYGSTLREAGETMSPMKASILSVGVNLVLNYLLIYGKLGFPEMGVAGAALATVIARYVETVYLLVHVYRNKKKYPFFAGAVRSLRIPMALVKKICKTGTPLLLNEFLWSLGTALINQSYSVRGLEVVAATNIASTVWQVFAIIMFSMGSAISIMCGQKLGANDIAGARDVDRKLIFTNVVIHILMGLLIIASARFIPSIYNVEQSVRDMTTSFLTIDGCVLWLHAFTHAAYFTIRSGGRTVITFLFDSVFTWVVCLPIAFILCNYTSMSIITIFAIIQCTDILKIGVALPLLISGSWARNVIT